jgi:hypothetical protein
MMAASRGGRFEAVPLAAAVATLRTVDLDLLDLAETFFG